MMSCVGRSRYFFFCVAEGQQLCGGWDAGRAVNVQQGFNHSFQV